MKATKLPTKPSTNESEALVKAKAQLAVHGLALTPYKSDAQSSDPSTQEGPSPLQVDSNLKPSKRAKSGKDSTKEETRKLESSKNQLGSSPRGATDPHVEDWLQDLASKPALKRKFTMPRKHVATVQELFKQGHSKQKVDISSCEVWA